MASAVDMQTFIHEELLDASTYIRLLRISSIKRKRDVPVHCELTTWPKASAPKYTAISYTWGDPNLLAVILVNGKRMQVRRNCEDVLRQPCRNKGGYFWIDAICINQADNKEKSFQVASMSDVYKDASQVLACVGRHEDDSDFLFRRLHRHRRFWESFNHPFLESSYGLRPVSDDQMDLWQRWRRQSTVARLHDALAMLLDRTYFKRVWIYQELFFGQDIEICCEDGKVELSILWGLYLAFHAPVPNARPLLAAGVKLTTGRPISNFSVMVSNIKEFQSEDPRDRVFGILAMVEWHDIKPIQPDYGKDRFDLAVEVLERFGQSKFDPNVDCSNTLMVAQLLRLLDQPSSRLADEVQKRQSKRFEYSPVNLTRNRQETVTMSSVYLGRRLDLHDAGWRIQSESLPDDNLFPTIEQWSKGHVWDVHYADTLLPQEAQPNDWLLIPTSPSMASKERAFIAFIARDNCDGRLRLVNKALFTGWAYWPTQEYWQNGGSMCDVRLDPEDAIVLAHSCNWDDWEKGLRLKDDNIDDYFGTRLTGDRGRSYAESRVSY